MDRFCNKVFETFPLILLQLRWVLQLLAFYARCWSYKNERDLSVFFSSDQFCCRLLLREFSCQSQFSEVDVKTAFRIREKAMEVAQVAGCFTVIVEQ